MEEDRHRRGGPASDKRGDEVWAAAPPSSLVLCIHGKDYVINNFGNPPSGQKAVYDTSSVSSGGRSRHPQLIFPHSVSFPFLKLLSGEAGRLIGRPVSRFLLKAGGTAPRPVRGAISKQAPRSNGRGRKKVISYFFWNGMASWSCCFLFQQFVHRDKAHKVIGNADALVYACRCLCQALRYRSPLTSSPVSA